MRFMAIVKATRDYEAGQPPNPELMAAMGKLAIEQAQLGVLIGGGGLLPSRHGHMIRMSGGKVTVTDGPFTESKEVIGGFALLNYATHEEAIAGAHRVMAIHAQHGITELEMELRPMMEDPACGPQMPQEASAAA